jgi:hypothetical protein
MSITVTGMKPILKRVRDMLIGSTGFPEYRGEARRGQDAAVAV